MITGGHTGIGFASAKNLASTWKFDLVLAGRSLERMEPAAHYLRTTFGVRVTLLTLDTSSMSSVRAAAESYRALRDGGEAGPLDALLCNAGGRFEGPSTFSPDGYETTFATNYLGHFLLVELMTEYMAERGRIVFTTSGTHDPETADGKLVGIAAEPDAVSLANDGKDGYPALSPGKRYSTSKLCMILCAYELHRRLRSSGSSIASIAYDPGSVPETGLMRQMPKFVQWLAKTRLMKLAMKKMGVTQGTINFSGLALAAVAADDAHADGSGKYFQSNDGELKETRSSAVSYDERRAAKLWDDCRVLVRLQPNESSQQLR